MFLNSWSAVLKGRVCSTRKTEKRSSSFTTFWFKFAVAELAPKSVNFLHRYAASTYPLCFEVSVCLLIFVPIVYWHSTWRKTFTFPWFLNKFEFVKPRIVEFHTIFLVLWRNWLWIVRYVFCNVSIFFTVPILLGINWKIGLKWKQNSISSRRYGYRAEDLKIIRRFSGVEFIEGIEFLPIICHFKHFSAYT